MKWNRQRSASSLLGLLSLALFFFIGVVFGQVLAARIPVAAGDELDRYLRHFLTLNEPLSPRAFFSSLLLYLRYPLLAFLLGFASIGVILLPCSAAAFGFFLSFSVSCFAAVFGEGGVMVALASSGLRCAVTLPCFFLLAVPSWKTSAALASLTVGKERRSAPVIYSRRFWIRLAVCLAILLTGMCVDLFVSSRLLRFVLERVLM